MTIEAQRTALVSMPVPKPTLSQVIIEKIREGATLEETKQYYGFMREIQRDEARVQFDADFVVMQGELPEVPKLGRIDHGGGRGYNYARWEDINDRIKPVLQKYGFGLRFDIITETESLFEIEAILVHRSGYSICTRKKLPIDKSGAKNIVQAYGSTQSYAQRYSAIALLNLTSRNEDTDAVGLPKGRNESVEDVALGLSEEEVAALTKAIKDSGRTVKWFCEFAKLKELEELPCGRYEAALNYVNKLPKVDNAAGQ
jgi:ERF superfamily